MNTTRGEVFVKGHITRTIILDPQTKRFPIVSSHSRSTYFELPGGKVKKGETPAYGAAREVHEETGITLNSLRLVGTFQNPIPQDEYTVWEGHLFLGLHPETELKLPPDEIRFGCYTTFEEVLAMPLEYFSRRLLERVKPPRRP